MFTKTTVISSSAGAGLTTGLHFIGKVASVATVVATTGDIMAHGTCARASDPALANAALQSIP
jgi:hypothetical protein